MRRLRWQIGRLTSRRSVATLPDGTILTMGPLSSTTPTLGELQAINVRGDDEISARVDGVTELGTVAANGEIRRRDGLSETIVRITVDSDKRTQIMNTLLDPGYAASVGIQNEASLALIWWQSMQEGTLQGMITAVVLAILIVFLLMAFFYESFIAPLAALSSVPLALLGVFAYLGLSGKEIGSMTFIACFFLVGIVVNNGIVLVDHLRKRVAPDRCRSNIRVMRALAGASVVVWRPFCSPVSPPSARHCPWPWAPDVSPACPLMS